MRQILSEISSVIAGALLAFALPSQAQVLHGGVSVDVPREQNTRPPPRVNDGPGGGEIGDGLSGALNGVVGGVLGGLFGGGRSSPRERYDMTIGQVYADAQRAAAAIDATAGRGDPNDPTVPDALSRLRDDQVRLPPNMARPASCLGVMIGGWTASQQGRGELARTQTETALNCYRQALGANKRDEFAGGWSSQSAIIADGAGSGQYQLHAEQNDYGTAGQYRNPSAYGPPKMLPAGPPARSGHVTGRGAKPARAAGASGGASKGATDKLLLEASATLGNVGVAKLDATCHYKGKRQFPKGWVYVCLGNHPDRAQLGGPFSGINGRPSPYESIYGTFRTGQPFAQYFVESLDGIPLQSPKPIKLERY